MIGMQGKKKFDSFHWFNWFGKRGFGLLKEKNAQAENPPLIPRSVAMQQ
jgi:hypothetical protein